MNSGAIIRRLEGFPAVVAALVRSVSDEEARVRSASGAWSIAEIVAHLADEEELDFRARLGSTLRDARAPWPSIDPEGWARQRGYNAMNLGEVLERFTRARAESVAWLRSLEDANWSIAHPHPKFGPIKAGDLLAAWAAHDALHLRQIAKRLYERAAHDAPGFSTRYAGDWGP